MRDDARPRVTHPNDGGGRDLDREERIEREHREEREEIIDREGDDGRLETPRRYEEEDKAQENPTLPSDDPTLRIEI
jgi:hypothetical protein